MLARGLGTRMRRDDAAATLDVAQASMADAGLKVLMPVGRPFLDYVIASLAEAGITDVCLVIGDEHQVIRDRYARDCVPTGVGVTFAVQAAPRGTAHAVLAAAAFVGDADFLVVNGDNLYPRRALEAVVAAGAPALAAFSAAALTADGLIDAARIAQFAIIEIAADGTLSAIVEKPPVAATDRRDLRVSMNLWAFPSSILDACAAIPPSPRGELELPEAVRFAIDRQHAAFRAVAGRPARRRPLDARRHRARACAPGRCRGAVVMRPFEDTLVARGMTPAAAARAEAMFLRIEDALASLGADGQPASRWFVPGRIEVLGKHTDYCGGRSLLAAIDRGFCLVARPRADRTIRVVDVARQRLLELPLDSTDEGSDPWMTYPRAVVRRLVRNFPEMAHGADVAFANDVPSAAGMSTSSALIVAIFLGVAHATRIVDHARYSEVMPTLADVAAYAATLENGQTFKSLDGDAGVGTAGGSQDHTAILCAQRRALVQYAFCPVRHEQTIALPPDLTFVIGVSGVHAEKIGSVKDAYNRLPLMVRDVVAQWNSEQQASAATLDDVLRQAGGAAPLMAWIAAARVKANARAEWARRVEQFAEEAHVVIPGAADALRRGDLAGFGGFVDRSQALAQTHLGNQVGETIALARHGPRARRRRGLVVRGGVRRRRLGAGAPRRRARLHEPVALRVRRGVPGPDRSRGVLRDRCRAGRVRPLSRG